MSDHEDGHEHREPTMDDLWAQATEENEPLVRTAALIEISRRRKHEGEYWAAIGAAQSALDIFEKLNSHEQVGFSHMQIGRCLQLLKENTDALESFAKAGEAFQAVADDANRGDALRALGDTYEALDKPDEAALVRRDAINLLAAAESYTRAGIAALDLGESLGRAGKQAEALEVFYQAGEYFKKAEDVIGSIRANDRIAAALIDLNRIDEALSHLWEAVITADYIEDAERSRWGRYRLGWTMVTAGDHANALTLLEEAVTEYKSVNNYGAAAMADLQRAHAYNALGQFETASMLYRQVRSVLKSTNNPGDALLALVNVGENQARAGSLLDSEDTFSRCLTEAIEIEDEWMERAVRVRFAEVQIMLDKPQAALEVLDGTDPESWGDDIADKARHYNAFAKALIGVARGQDALGKLERVLYLNLSNSLPYEAAKAYEMMATGVSGISDSESNQLLAQAIALYLASGQEAKARDLSQRFLPSDNSQAVQMLKRRFDQPSNYEAEGIPEDGGTGD